MKPFPRVVVFFRILKLRFWGFKELLFLIFQFLGEQIGTCGSQKEHLKCKNSAEWRPQGVFTLLSINTLSKKINRKPTNRFYWDAWFSFSSEFLLDFI